MTPLKKETRRIHRYCNEDLQQALIDIRKKGRGVRETCRKYGIPRTTVQDRLSGKMCDDMKQKGPDPILGIEGEKRVEDWLLNITRRGFPIKKQDLLETVQKIMQVHKIKNPFKNDCPGKSWYLKFLKRHPHIALCRVEGINKAKAPVTEQSIRTWFDELETFLAESNNQGILQCPERIFNGDECGFSLCPKSGDVLLPRRFRNPRKVKPGNEKNILTIFITVNANSQVCPPLVVLPHVRPPRAVVDSLPEHWCLGKSDSGVTRSDVFFEYITNDFINWVDRNCIQKPILLLLDSHRSHMSLHLSTICEQNGIILYATPPNTSHTLQPVNVSIFEPMKSSWPSVVGNFLSKPENVNSRLNKTKFCQMFRDILEDSSMDATIKNGFRQCGLFPFNQDAVDYTKCDKKTTYVYVSNYLQNSLKNESNDPLCTSEDITNGDIVSTRKVINCLRAKLNEKRIDVDVILEELRELETQINIQNNNSEMESDRLVDYSSTIKMDIELYDWHQDIEIKQCKTE
ncbi:hypothetical protein SFRURICE_007247 [Spodoptera frugiperda]|nr:hypothetical protein SFRURICE_007247 [Spodoptera frugiperda]